MKNKTVLKLLALTAALTLTFSGCQTDSTQAPSSETSSEAAAREEAAAEGDASEEAAAEGGVLEEAAAEEDTSEEAAAGKLTEIPAEAEADVVAYLTDGAYTADAVVASAGDYTLKAGDVTQLAAYQYNSASYYYKMYGASLDLDEELEDGVTFAEYLFDYGREGSARYLAARAKAAELGIVLTKEQTDSLASLKEDNILQAGESLWTSAVEKGTVNADDYTEEEQAAWKEEHGAAYFLHSMMYYGTTPEQYIGFQEYSMYLTNLREKLFGEGGEYAMTEGEKTEKLQAYLEENGVLWARCILFSTKEAETEEAKADIKANAEKALEELEGLEGEALKDKFTELQSQYDKSGYTAGEVQRYTNSDALVDGFYSGIQALRMGEVGMTGETDYGYFILLREADQPEEIEEEITSTYESEKMTELLDEWLDEYGIKKDEVMDGLDLKSFFTKLGELQAAVEEADAA